MRSHAGNITVPTYQQLLGADVVIADAPTYNPDAFYELGVRRALKPRTTITIAEDKLVVSFDVGQIAMQIDRGEVVVTEAGIAAVLNFPTHSGS
jgi:hypothetical protein